MWPFSKKKDEVTRLVEATNQHYYIKNRETKMEKLTNNLEKHLKDNQFGQRLYNQMVRDRRS